MRSRILRIAVTLYLAAFFNASLQAQQDRAASFRWDTASINNLLNDAKKITLSGDLDSAGHLYNLAEEQSLQSGYPYGYIKGRIGLGNIAINKGDYKTALEHYKTAVKECKSPPSKILLTPLYNNIGNIYTLKGNYEISAQQYELALQSREQYGSELPLETIYNNLSIALNKLNMPVRSLFYLEKAEQLALSNNNYYTLADIYNNKGAAYTELKDTKKSMASFNEAVLISKKCGYLNTLYSALVNLGITYLNEGKIRQAIAKFEETDGMEANANSYYQNLKALASGAAYLKNKNYIKAKAILLQSLKQAQQIGNLKDELTTHSLLAALYSETGDYETALEHKNRELLLSDSLKNKETASIVTMMEAKYNAALKDKALAKEYLTVSRQSAALSRKNMWIAIVVICLAAITILAFIQRRNFRHKQKIKDEQLEVLKERQKNIEMKAILDGAEKERIRISREIHDSIMVQFSVVKMNLSSYTSNNGEPLTAEKLQPIVKQLDDATDNLRLAAHHLMPDRLEEDGLEEALFYFCNNLQKNIPIKISFQTVGVIPLLPSYFELSLYRIIQELMQNIIKHSGADEAILQISAEQEHLTVIVEDNGKGMDCKAAYQGLGLKSIHARVNEFQGNMTIDSAPNVGTTVHLEFDLDKIQELTTL